MTRHATILGPDARPPDSGRVSTALPRDLLEQVRSRVQLLALLLLFAFALDPLLFAAGWVAARVSGRVLPPEFLATNVFQWFSIGAVAASATLWAVARGRRVSPSLLHNVGLAYEIVICFVLAISSFWQYFLDTQRLPNLTWVPLVVVLFPLILPGPPRRMLVAAIAAAAMSPLALLLLHQWGKVTANSEDVVRAILAPGIAVVFAYMGARVVYGLGRAVLAARELGSYRLEERLGAGGMGEVWRARHRMLARPAAIKLIRAPAGADGDGPRVISPELTHRFEREAQAIASLRSPNTVNLYDFGVADDGALYYVMELLDGLDADSLVRRFGPIPYARAIYLLRQLCHSLAEADARGLVHRDVKPANIFVCRYGEDCDFVKVLDFGLVKVLAEAQPPEHAGSRADVIRGTPAFMAPEQVLGTTPPDGRTDVYGTGCVAYWLLTGRLVFEADTTLALLMQHVHTAPTPPSARTELPIPPALDELVLSCLAKDPGARPASARELARRLAGIPGGDAWTADQALAWWATHQPELVAREG